MTETQLAGIIVLLVFGFLYDSIVSWLLRIGRARFMAPIVILGTLVTLFVLYLGSRDATYTAEVWLVLTVIHFAASGFGMTLGSWQRAG